MVPSGGRGTHATHSHSLNSTGRIPPECLASPRQMEEAWGDQEDFAMPPDGGAVGLGRYSPRIPWMGLGPGQKDMRSSREPISATTYLCIELTDQYLHEAYPRPDHVHRAHQVRPTALLRKSFKSTDCVVLHTSRSARRSLRAWQSWLLQTCHVSGVASAKSRSFLIAMLLSQSTNLLQNLKSLDEAKMLDEALKESKPPGAEIWQAR